MGAVLFLSSVYLGPNPQHTEVPIYLFFLKPILPILVTLKNSYELEIILIF